MTGTAPVLDRPALWAALSTMRIPGPEASDRFEEALARRQGWTVGFAERVTDEYRRFLYLAATAGSEVTPSQAVDEAWHLHLGCPHYREILCGRILRRPLDHRPSSGEPGEEERHRRQYEDTLARYERAFRTPPPSDIWPGASTRDERQAAERRRRGRKVANTLSATAGVAALVIHVLGYPAAALVLLGVAILSALSSLLFFPGAARSSGGGGCGGAGCGGGGNSAEGSSCGASCGGGGCGGD